MYLFEYWELVFSALPMELDDPVLIPFLILVSHIIPSSHQPPGYPVSTYLGNVGY